MEISICVNLRNLWSKKTSSQDRQVIRQHVAPVIPIMPAPFSVIEPVLDAFAIENFGEAIRFVPGVVPLARADDDAHVIVFPWVIRVRQIFIRTVKVNIFVVVTVEERADVERAAQADQMANQIGVAKGNVGGVIRTKAGTTDGDSMAIAFAPRQLEHVADN